MLKRYFNRSSEEETLRRVIARLLQGISLHAIEGDQRDFERFRDDLAAIHAGVNEEATGEDLLIITSKTLHLMSKHAQKTSAYFRDQGTVFRNIISNLTRTMVSMGAGTETSANRLQQIESQLTQAVETQDMRDLKRQLYVCLAELREEARRQKYQAQAQAAQIQTFTANAEDRSKVLVSDEGEIDSVTGLPSQSAAKAIFEERLRAPGRKYVVVAALARMQSINTRFGLGAANEVLKTFAAFVCGKLSGADGLFRWKGSAFVALIEREEPIEFVRSDIKRISQTRLEKTLDMGGRKIMLPLSAFWSVVPLLPPLDAVTKSIDSFIAAQLPSEQ